MLALDLLCLSVCGRRRCCCTVILNVHWFFFFCRAIFDTDECELFADKLETRIRAHDRDIEKLCSAHHHGFIESIHDLLQLAGLAKKLHVTKPF